MTKPPMTSETRGRKLRATELLKDGYHERAERVAAGNEFMSDEPAVRACVEAVGGLSLADAFEMGCEWGRGLQGQTLEDSRAVGRTLYSDTLAPIVDAIDREIREHGFNSFEDADAGIFAAKVIIKAALALPSPVRQGEDGEEAPWIVWSNEHSAFWRANRCGYTGSIEQAGRYTRAEAEAICRSACPRSNSTIYEGTPPEICMPAPEALSPVRESVLEEAANAVENLTTDGFGNWASWAGWNNAKKFAAAAIRALKSDPDFTGHIDCPEDEGGRG